MFSKINNLKDCQTDDYKDLVYHHLKRQFLIMFFLFQNQKIQLEFQLEN